MSEAATPSVPGFWVVDKDRATINYLGKSIKAAGATLARLDRSADMIDTIINQRLLIDQLKIEEGAYVWEGSDYTAEVMEAV